MREESNRIVEGMEKARRAEKEQRQRELQALKEDAAYTERITKENQAIELQNLENQKNQEIANITEGQNAQRTYSDISQGLGELAKFSQTLGREAERRTAKMIKDQTNLGLSGEVQNISADDIETHKDSISIQAQGAIRLDTEIAINGVLNNESRYETIKGYVSNHGYNGIAARVNDNRVALQAYNNTLSARLQNAEKTYTSANGKKYTGIQALKDPELMADLQNKTRKDVSAYMGFTNPLYLSEANEQINQGNKAYLKSAEAAFIKEGVAVIEQQANTIASEGTPQAIGKAFQRMRSLPGGNEKAHDWVESLADNLSIPEEAVRDFDSRGDGKGYSIQQKNRWKAFSKRRQKVVVQQQEFELRQKRSAYNTEINTRVGEIYQQMQADPDATYAQLESHALSQGLPVSPVITKMYSSALKNNKDATALLLKQLADKNILDISFVNSLDDSGLQTEGKRLLQEQQIRKYGENYPALLAGIEDHAQSLAEYSSPVKGATNTITEQIKIFIQNWIKEDLKDTQNSNVTIIKLKELVASASGADPSVNPFSYKVVGSGRVFANIGVVNTGEVKEQKEFNTYLLNLSKTKTLGQIASTPYLLADKNQLEEVSAAAAAGRGFKYPYHVQTTADMYGMKPSEVINEQIKAANAVDGSNIPLLAGPVVELLDNASVIKRKELQSDNPIVIERGAVRDTNLVAQNLRPSMRPPGVKGLADLVSSGEGNPAAMFPGETYPEMLDMTIGEVVNFQKEKLRDGRSSAAVGAYQFLYPERAAQRAGLSMNDKFTPENQLKMFLGTLLNKPGRENVSRFLQGTGDNIEAAIDEMAQEFASIEYKNGRSYYNDGVNKASISREQVRAALLAAREERITR